MDNLPSDLKIQLTLSSVGFNGADLDCLAPDFESDQNVSRSLKWFPCVTGPETWVLLFSVALPLQPFLKKFMELLAEDVYAWAKDRLEPFFKRRPNNSGSLTIELDSVVIYSESPLEVLTSPMLRDALLQIDPSTSSEWRLEYSAEADEILVFPEN